MDPTQLENIVLALLFASEEPISTKKIAAILEDVPLGDIKSAIERLESRIAEDYPSIVVERVAGGLQLVTSVAYADYIARLYSGKRKQRLSKAAMEALAVIAYKQPITRVDVETIRGVGCGGVITTLMERSLIRIVGKAKVLGAPFLYGTTPEFLEYLGLNSLRDLPSMDELEALLEHEEETREIPGTDAFEDDRAQLEGPESSTGEGDGEQETPADGTVAVAESSETRLAGGGPDDDSERAAGARIVPFTDSPSESSAERHGNSEAIDDIPADAKE